MGALITIFWVTGWMFTMGMLAQQIDQMKMEESWGFKVFLSVITLLIWPFFLGGLLMEVAYSLSNLTKKLNE